MILKNSQPTQPQNTTPTPAVIQPVQKPKVSIQPAKVKSLLLNLKKPKILVLIILLAASSVAIAALNLTSKQQEEEFLAPPTTPFSSPSPTIDPNQANSAQNIGQYNQRIENLKDFKKELPYPIVNLDINFEE